MSFCTLAGFMKMSVKSLFRMAGTTRLELATSAVTAYKTAHSVGWVVGWKKAVFPTNGWPLLLAAVALTEPIHVPKLTVMEVHIKPETESRLTELASKSGRATDDLVEDALAGYLTEVAEVREMLDGRYDDIKSGRVKPIDGEAFFDGLRQREDELLKQRNPK